MLRPREPSIVKETTGSIVFNRRWAKYRRIRAIVSMVVLLLLLLRLGTVFPSMLDDPHWLDITDAAAMVVASASTARAAWLCVGKANVFAAPKSVWRALVAVTWAGIATSMVLTQLKCEFLSDKSEVSDLYTCRSAQAGLVSGAQLTTITGWTLLSSAVFSVGDRDTSIGAMVAYAALLGACEAAGVDTITDVRATAKAIDPQPTFTKPVTEPLPRCVPQWENLRYIATHVAIVAFVIYIMHDSYRHEERLVMGSIVVRAEQRSVRQQAAHARCTGSATGANRAGSSDSSSFARGTQSHAGIRDARGAWHSSLPPIP